MSKIVNIPESVRDGYIELNSIDEKVFLQLEKGLQNTDLTLTIKEISSKLEQSTGVDFMTILLSVGSAMAIKDDDIKIEEFAQNIADVLDEDKIIEFNESATKEQFTKRLLALVSAEPLYYASKSLKLMNESGNVFLEARILTDIRPVFNDKLDPPKAAVIIHNLHLHYRQDHEGMHKDIFFTLDSNDIVILREMLKRAEAKELALKDFFTSANMVNLTQTLTE